MNLYGRLAIALSGVIAATGLYWGWRIGTDHLGEAQWSDHAKFHASVGGLYLATLGIVLVAAVWTRARRWENAGDLPLALAILLLPAAVLAAVAVVPGGAPSGGQVGLAGLFLIVSIVTVILIRLGRS